MNGAWVCSVRALPGQMVISADYSANRSTHLPWGGAAGATTANRNYIPSSIRRQFNQPGPCNPDGTVDFSNLYAYNNLNCNVTNPFYSMLQGPTAIFNEPDSRYNDPQIPLINLLRPNPQFDGTFEGLPILGAESFYNALQIRFRNAPATTSVSRAATPCPSRRTTRLPAETPGGRSGL